MKANNARLNADPDVGKSMRMLTLGSTLSLSEPDAYMRDVHVLVLLMCSYKEG